MSPRQIRLPSDNYIPVSNINSAEFLFKVSEICDTFAFIVPTETGLKKGIMDATAMVRVFLHFSGLHNYDNQGQGEEEKKLIHSYFVNENDLKETKTSLYRPKTKQGDPRIWIYGLSEYANPKDLLLLYSVREEIYIVNLSKQSLSDSFNNKGYVYNEILKSREEEENVKEELLGLLKDLHDKGWIKATTKGDTAVGDTLEHELGIARNNSTSPDYKGIELKSSRINRRGKNKQKTRITLFAKVPDEGLTYREILENYGKYQTPEGSTESRLQLYETFTTKRINSYDLYLRTNSSAERLDLMHSDSRNLNDENNEYVSSWRLETLVNSLKEKHKETFFVKAESKEIDGVEYFHYCKAIYTFGPKFSILFALFDEDVITLDLAIHKVGTKTRDHGALFKIHPDNLSLLFGEEEEFNFD